MTGSENLWGVPGMQWLLAQILEKVNAGYDKKKRYGVQHLAVYGAAHPDHSLLLKALPMGTCASELDHEAKEEDGLV